MIIELLSSKVHSDVLPDGFRVGDECRMQIRCRIVSVAAEEIDITTADWKAIPQTSPGETTVTLRIVDIWGGA